MKQGDLFGPLFTEVKIEFWETLESGGERDCPCCGRFAKIYKRKLNSGMARALIWVWKRNGLSWFNLESELRYLIKAEPKTPRSGDPAKLCYWELLDRAVKENKGSPGDFRVTPKGERFAKNQIRVPRHVFVYDTRRRGFSDEGTDVEDALGNHFDWSELMRSKEVR